ncbi:hypothetical protein [Enterovirga aerilata]|uniref:Integrase catalytic domain-containing protein n=1 Tax=Enterovirga aerilata TaxID=2730920 RepID=A0A849I7U7_9HYPH|nr:hypothetical protein [Enterovirga sp. DB1703]NNM73844.1 hypothetical protein [Enterovirga sp. DB1703]
MTPNVPAHIPAPALVPALPVVDKPAATLRFDLHAKDVFRIGGRTWEFERRLDDRLQFLCLSDRDLLFVTDQQLAFMASTGEASIIVGKGRYAAFRAPFPNRITLTDAQNAEADRKLAYVEPCLRGHVEGDGPRTPYRFKRSRRKLMPLIEEVAAARGETPPDFTTVLNWIDLWTQYGSIHGTACLVGLHALKGNRRTPFGGIGEIALGRGLSYWLNPDVSTELAYAKVVSTVKAVKRSYRRFLSCEELARISTPSLRTFQRRCAALDQYTRDYYRISPSFAAKNRTYETQPLPDRPYQDVEVDNCTLDILLVDDESDIVLGRADLILFRCRATGMHIGYAVGYEAPSYASFVAGLRHAMYPKDMARFPAVNTPWPCFGKIENLWVDNGLHFIGKDIEAACRELKINKPRFRPKTPWYKGALERFFGYQNTGLIHLLPGSTKSNAVKLKDYDENPVEHAKIRFSDFEALLVFFLVEIHNARISRGLGLLRGVGDIPLRVWNEKAKNQPSGPLPPAELFIALCGEWEMRTIQNDGIVWDYIKYESPELSRLLTHPEHRSARQSGKGTQYKCVRDPNNLGRIYVENPYDPTGAIIVVPATKAHRAYAEGRHRHVHDLAVAHAKLSVKKALDFDGLMDSLAHLADLAVAARSKPGRKRVQRRLARFLHAQRVGRLASTVTPGKPADAGTAAHLDPLAIAQRVRRGGEREEDEPPQPPANRLPALPPPAAHGVDAVPAEVAEPDAQGPDPQGPYADLDPEEDDLSLLRASRQWSTADE